MIFQSSVEWHRWQVKSTELASSSAEMSGPRGDPGGVSYRVRDICSSLCLLTGSVILQMPAFLFPSWFPNPGFFHFLSHLLLCLRNTGLYVEASVPPTDVESNQCISRAWRPCRGDWEGCWANAGKCLGRGQRGQWWELEKWSLEVNEDSASARVSKNRGWWSTQSPSTKMER